MSKNIIKTTQFFIFLNLLSQLFWVVHLNFPKIIRLNLEQLKLLITVIVIIYIASGIFLGIYLFKKHYRLQLITLIVHGTYYIFILYYWYQLILSKIKFENYKMAYYGLLVTSFLFGLSLLFSETRNKTWIKRSGFVILTICMIDFSFELFPESEDNTVLQFVKQGAGFIGGIVSVFWMLNFQEEIKSLPHESNSLIDTP